MTVRPRRPGAGAGRVVVAGAMVGIMLLGVVAIRVWPDLVLGVAQAVLDGLRGMGPLGVAMFAVLQIVVALSGVLPASLLGVAAGAIYGFLPGFLLASASTMAGAMAAFLLCRSMFRPAIETMMRRHAGLRAFDASVTRDGWKFVLLLRISPVMPFSATSYLLGLSSLGMRDCFIGTLASLPALGGYVFLGTLADAGMSAWGQDAGPLRWAFLALGGVATVALLARIGWIVARLGLRPSPKGTTRSP